MKASTVEAANRATYDSTWSAPVGPLKLPAGIWYEVSRALPNNPKVLEVGAGIKPSIPIKGNYFLDISEVCIKKLNELGGIGKVGLLNETGYESGTFDAVFAFEIFEHIEDDLDALNEIGRILKPGGLLVLSVPLYKKLWTSWDIMASHVRRYEPAGLKDVLLHSGFEIQRYKTRFGYIRPWSVKFPVWIHTHFPRISTTVAHYLGFYPARFLDRYKKGLYKDSGFDIEENATGVTVVARKA